MTVLHLGFLYMLFHQLSSREDLNVSLFLERLMFSLLQTEARRLFLLLSVRGGGGRVGIIVKGGFLKKAFWGTPSGSLVVYLRTPRKENYRHAEFSEAVRMVTTNIPLQRVQPHAFRSVPLVCKQH